MKRVRKTPHELGYRFYRGYAWTRKSPIPDSPVCLYNPAGQFVCQLKVRDVPRYVNKSIKYGWEDKFMPKAEPAGFDQLELFGAAA